MLGWTLAVDFPAKHEGIYEFLDDLDQEITDGRRSGLLGEGCETRPRIQF